jgi:hypothetical protein
VFPGLAAVAVVPGVVQRPRCRPKTCVVSWFFLQPGLVHLGHFSKQGSG